MKYNIKKIVLPLLLTFNVGCSSLPHNMPENTGLLYQKLPMGNYSGNYANNLAFIVENDNNKLRIDFKNSDGNWNYFEDVFPKGFKNEEDSYLLNNKKINGMQITHNSKHRLKGNYEMEKIIKKILPYVN
jgi:hypothetical protein